MNEDVKKHLRTQGKYSEKSLHSDERCPQKLREKRHRVSPALKESQEKKFSKRNSNGRRVANTSASDESESPLRYQEKSDYSFSELEEVKKPIEIKEPGKTVLSQTDNGESVVLYDPYFMEEEEAENLMERLYSTTNWNEKNIVIQGVEYPQPRLVAWYGPFPYSYSGTTLEPAEMPETVLGIKRKVEEYLMQNGINVCLNSVLLNLYRNNKDSVSWHSDDELTMGVCPTIASVSLGEVRKFEMRRKLKRFENESAYDKVDKYFVNLTSGSLIIMNGCMQKDWQHRVPKEYHDKHSRINLTFRTVYALEKIPPVPVSDSKKQPIENITKTPPPPHSFDESDFPPLNCDTNPRTSFDESDFPPLDINISPVYSDTNSPQDKAEDLNSTVITDEENWDTGPPLIKKSSSYLTDDKKNKKINMRSKNFHSYDTSVSNDDVSAGENESFSSVEGQNLSVDSPKNNIHKDISRVKKEPVCSRNYGREKSSGTWGDISVVKKKPLSIRDNRFTHNTYRDISDVRREPVSSRNKRFTPNSYKDMSDVKREPVSGRDNRYTHNTYEDVSDVKREPVSSRDNRWTPNAYKNVSDIKREPVSSKDNQWTPNAYKNVSDAKREPVSSKDNQWTPNASKDVSDVKREPVSSKDNQWTPSTYKDVSGAKREPVSSKDNQWTPSTYKDVPGAKREPVSSKDNKWTPSAYKDVPGAKREPVSSKDNQWTPNAYKDVSDVKREHVSSSFDIKGEPVSGKDNKWTAITSEDIPEDEKETVYSRNNGRTYNSSPEEVWDVKKETVYSRNNGRTYNSPEEVCDVKKETAYSRNNGRTYNSSEEVCDVKKETAYSRNNGRTYNSSPEEVWDVKKETVYSRNNGRTYNSPEEVCDVKKETVYSRNNGRIYNSPEEVWDVNKETVYSSNNGRTYSSPEDMCEVKKETVYGRNNRTPNSPEEEWEVKTELTPGTDSWQPNVEAAEFVPTFPVYGSFRLEDLLNYNVDVMPLEQLLEFAFSFKNRVLEKIKEFRYSDQEELELLCEITDGTLSEKNQRLVTRRMFYIVTKRQESSLNVRKAFRPPRQPKYWTERKSNYENQRQSSYGKERVSNYENQYQLSDKTSNYSRH